MPDIRVDNSSRVHYQQDRIIVEYPPPPVPPSESYGKHLSKNTYYGINLFASLFFLEIAPVTFSLACIAGLAKPLIEYKFNNKVPGKPELEQNAEDFGKYEKKELKLIEEGKLPNRQTQYIMSKGVECLAIFAFQSMQFYPISYGIIFYEGLTVAQAVGEKIVRTMAGK